ncbi:RGS domain-containing protein [Thelonectria olida]|uniref:RGS domain-containing protein n=1 Tax=Thelonectria olida TaxID=1576542 RepID=A0A9P9AFH0_9HYPO|nr:RGS domain-containing protein [Thelonectria olida]
MPLLANIISDLSPDPWTLYDFTVYLSSNDCLETLQFFQDASRYRYCYAEIVGGNRTPWVSVRCDYDYLRALWEDLLENYILPNGQREVNLPSEVRDRLLGFCSSDLLPHPSELDDAVKIVRELIEDSILPGFLNSHMSAKQPSNGVRGALKRIGSSLRRKILTSLSEWDP